MPKEAVYRLTCERCSREWFPSAKDGEPVTATATLSFKDASGAEVVSNSYEVLCESCANAIGNYLKQVTKDLTKIGGKKKAPKISKVLSTPELPKGPASEGPTGEKPPPLVRPVTPPPSGLPRR